MPFVRADAVEEAAWRALETFLISPQIIFDQVGSPSHQIALLEKELQGIEQERGELVKRQSRLLDLYERADRTLLEELDARMARNKAAQAALDRRALECQERIGYYRQQQIDPDQVYRVLSQIEEIIRFATPEHRLEIFRSLFSEIIVKPDKTLDISAKLPTNGVIQRLSVALCPSKEEAGDGISNCSAKERRYAPGSPPQAQEWCPRR
jgi:hypothetical protein